MNYDYIKQAVELPLLFILKFYKNQEVPNPKRILIINTALIGDTLASLPALSKFIENRKHAKIDILVPSPMKSVFEKVEGINKVYIAKSLTNRKIEKERSDKQLEEMIHNKYDLIVIIRLSADAYGVLRKLNAKSIKSPFFPYSKYLLNLTQGGILSKGKNVKQYRTVNFELIGEKIEDRPFEKIFNFSRIDYEKIKKIPVMGGREKKIIIHTGSGWRRLWDNGKWAELIRKINGIGKYKFIFVGGNYQEERDFKEIQSMLDFKICSLINKVDLAELLLVMRLSDCFIGVDSGPRNMAHLADLRSVSLLGPGPRHFMPFSKKDIVIDRSNCICFHLFCLRKETCMQKIGVPEVFEGFKKLQRQRINNGPSIKTESRSWGRKRR